MMSFTTIEQIPLTGMRVFIRVDFNVPLNKSGAVTDDTRIREAVPTIQYARQQGAKVLLASHLGRPKGKVDPAFSLKPVAERLATLLASPVTLAPDCVVPSSKSAWQRWQTAKCCCLKTSASMLKRRKTTRHSPKRLPVSLTCTSTMPSVPPIVRMLRWLAWSSISPTKVLAS